MPSAFDVRAFAMANEVRLVRCTWTVAQQVSVTAICFYIWLTFAGSLSNIYPAYFVFLAPFVWTVHQFKYYGLARIFCFSIAIVAVTMTSIGFGSESFAFFLFVPLSLASLTLFGTYRSGVLAFAVCVLTFSLLWTDFAEQHLVLIDPVSQPVLPPIFVILSMMMSYSLVNRFFRINIEYRARATELVQQVKSRNSILAKRQAEAREQADRLAATNADLKASIANDLRIERQFNSSNEQLEQFAYAASHDLKEPLRSIASFVQVIQRKLAAQQDQELQEYFEIVVNSSARMGKLLDDLLIYSRAAKVPAPVELTKLRNVVKLVLHEFRGLINQSQAIVVVDVADLEVYAPRGYVQTIIRELISNALIFCEPGTNPVINISSQEAGTKVDLYISDRGIGIAPEYHARVFNLFERLNPGEDYIGSGVGLALVRKLTKECAITVNIVEGLTDKGVCFKISLPITPPLSEN